MHPPHFDDGPRFDILRNPIVYIIILVSLYMIIIYFNFINPWHKEFEALTPYQQFIVENTDVEEEVLVVDYQFAGLNYPELYQINRSNNSPYLVDAPYSLEWQNNPSVEERIATYSSHAKLWLERLEKHINDSQTRLIISSQELHTYLEGVDFIEQRYDLVIQDGDFIAYILVDN